MISWLRDKTSFLLEQWVFCYIYDSLLKFGGLPKIQSADFGFDCPISFLVRPQVTLTCRLHHEAMLVGYLA